MSSSLSGDHQGCTAVFIRLHVRGLRFTSISSMHKLSCVRQGARAISGVSCYRDHVYAVKIFHACLLIFLISSSSSLGWTEPQPDLVLKGVITHADDHSYREVPFTVPAGITRLTIDFSYTTRDQHTTIDLGLFDGERFRGWSGGNKAAFTI